MIYDRKFKKYNTEKLNKNINLNQSYKKEQKSREREREREREYSMFLCGKKSGLNRINDIKFIQNKIERRKVKI